MNNCIICKADEWFRYCSIEDAKYNVLFCKKCSFATLNPLPSQEELNKYYSRRYREKYSNQDIVDQDVIDYEQLRAITR